MRSVLGCTVVVICGAQRALAQTLQCPLVGSARYPVLPASHSCAAFFGSADAQGTADGQGLCAILNIGLGEACGGVASVPTEGSWWADHLSCSSETANCKTTDEIIGASSASRHPYASAPDFADGCYKVCVVQTNATLIRIELTPTLAACSEINDVCLDGELPQGGSSAGITWMGKMSGCVPASLGCDVAICADNTR